jgi:hypothetical protein
MTAVFIGYVHLRVSHRIHRDFKSLSNKSYKKDLIHINNKVHGVGSGKKKGKDEGGGTAIHSTDRATSQV